jgi:hypothetical protein
MAMDGLLIINKPACTILYSYCFLLVIRVAKGMLSSLLPLLVTCYIGLPCRSSTCGMILNDYAVLTIALANFT